VIVQLFVLLKPRHDLFDAYSAAFVLPEYRGNHIMNKLERMLIEFFKSRNLNYIELNVMTKNILGKKIWSKLGYSTFREQMRKGI
jgi:ribosomal protein S18 acetylase RimI-like enzyme